MTISHYNQPMGIGKKKVSTRKKERKFWVQVEGMQEKEEEIHRFPNGHITLKLTVILSYWHSYDNNTIILSQLKHIVLILSYIHSSILLNLNSIK